MVFWIELLAGITGVLIWFCLLDILFTLDRMFNAKVRLYEAQRDEIVDRGKDRGEQ